MNTSSHNERPSGSPTEIDPESVNCPSCFHQETTRFFEIKSIPVHSNIMMETRDAAVNFMKADLALAFCTRCGFISNQIFNASLQNYLPEYEDQQSYSPTFNQFSQRLVNHLVEKYQIYDKDILEIGCGKGDFLTEICRVGNNRGIGIDPAARADRALSSLVGNVRFINDYYSKRYAHVQGDVVICRHTLEHVFATKSFLLTIRSAFVNRPDALFFFEVPETRRILRGRAFWDIYYEHCSYYTPGSLARFFRDCGFEILDLNLDFGNQYLLIEAHLGTKPSNIKHPREESLEELTSDVMSFKEHVSIDLTKWQDSIARTKSNGKEIAIWGSGSKCVAFLTTLNVRRQIDTVIDINPNRHGKYIPGVGHKIRSPEYLAAHPPGLVIIMNGIYHEEIRRSLAAMGLTPELKAL